MSQSRVCVASVWAQWHGHRSIALPANFPSAPSLQQPNM